ncbi:glycoside hydrolase family 18 protein [Talaromyces proteolyticus]|uniref:chitinase n=1 Tax=Talaromyces proteolyticus TaxID=1131652 RepID=A0AAD4KH10_9EURO|nr:glycoside hydrolase family 18 protein [Talaromyces proteolyticus]KAH8692178.1 glycoside hydrolase family 18 protein [Talaromyces proteolyticus]
MWVQRAATASLAVTTVAATSIPCPEQCAGTPEQWTVYSSVYRLGICEKPMLFDFAVHNPLEDPSSTVKVRTCTAKASNETSDSVYKRLTSSTCIVPTQRTEQSLDLFKSDTSNSEAGGDLEAALDILSTYLADSTHCETGFLAAYYGDVVVGIYSGSAIDKSKTIPLLVKQLKQQTSTAPKSMTAQLCGSGRNADYTFGVSIDTSGNIASVQKAVKSWSVASCVNSTQQATQLSNVAWYELSLPKKSTKSTFKRHLLHQREGGTCQTATVVSGDSCGSLASKCGISGNDLTKYNPQESNLCATLQVGERVCCTAGSLPDITPKPYANGTCATYSVKSGDYCSSIAASNGLNSTQIELFNNGTTWGWNGCNDIMAGMNICLSSGKPPLPAPVANAICGPTVLGTKNPTGKETLADLNPCPLNVCCNIWGQCGQTPDFCTAGSGPAGNPGTAPKNKNGCISNCGLDIHDNSNAPSSYIKVGYYESWNWDRSCLNYFVGDLAYTDYTHAHWAFASINTQNYSVFVNDTYKQFPAFLQLPQNKILSFGGWGISTDPSTYNELRSAMNPANVDTFVTNIVDYLNEQKLDGVDIDWEYPGAPDIPGIPPGLASDAPNYLAFLKKLRAKLPSGKTMSIAAPASYWYLKAFPIAEMAKELDYIVYMTYDLHGQWDYNNKWSQDGCETGNCLRSHVNLTETVYSLSMITKAGVPANKVIVGVASYGRSFGMSDPASCQQSIFNPKCTFTGPNSGADPGVCTVTPGYISNAEIEQLQWINESVTYKFDPGSDSDMLFNGTTWIGYMTDTTKSTRTEFYKGLNFGGTIEWAVDLEQWTGDNEAPLGIDNELPATSPIEACDATYNTLEDLDGAAPDIPSHCVLPYTLTALNNLLSEAMTNYTSLNNDGYDSKFKTYAKAISDSAAGNMHDFIYANGSQYFTCIVPEYSICCSHCKSNQPSGQPSYCDYCFSDGDCYHSVLEDRHPQQVLNYNIVNETEPCPPDYSKRGYGPNNPYEQSVYWTLTNSSGFYADLYTDSGIPQDKTKIGNYDRLNACAPSSKPDDDCWATGMDFDIPIVNGYSTSDVANPKDVVQQVQSNITNLPPQISNIQTLVSLDGWYGNSDDLIDSVSLPILMLAQATENMAQVVQVADKIEEEERKALILAFLSAIFLFLPIIGEVVGSVGALADVATVLSLLGVAGEVGTDIYGIFSDPQNAPLMIMDLILTPLSLGDVGNIAKASKIRRGMSDADIVKLGDKVGSRMKILDHIKGSCTKGLE